MFKILFRNWVLNKNQKPVDNPLESDKLAARSTNKERKPKPKPNYKNMKPLKPAVSINDILKQHAETISAPALRAASEKHAKELMEREANRALEALKEGVAGIANEVARLREIRKKEKNSQEVLLKLNTALEKFKKDGDVEAFANARREAARHRIGF